MSHFGTKIANQLIESDWANEVERMLGVGSDTTRYVKNSEGGDWTCDGVADDVQIQLALDDLTAGGWAEIASTLTYNLTNALSIAHSDIHLIGHGGILKQTVDTKNIINITGTGVKKVLIRNLQLNGNKTVVVTSGYGIYFDAVHTAGDEICRYENLYIYDCKTDGFCITSGREANLTNVYSYTNDGHGFNLGGSDHKLVNCVAGGNLKHGFFKLAANTQAINCKAFNSGTAGSAYYGFYLDGDSIRAQLSNCLAQDNQRHGFMISAGAIATLNGCYADSNGREAADLYDGFRVEGSYNTLVGGKAYDRDGTPTQHYGIRVGNVSYNTIVGNNCVGNIHDGIYISDANFANNTIRNNAGYIIEASGTSAIPSGQTHVHVTHTLGTGGVALTPMTIVITPTAQSTADPTFYPWVNTIGTVEFIVNCTVDPGVLTLPFMWHAKAY